MRSKNLDNRWNALYLVHEVKESRGTYLLKELEGCDDSEGDNGV